MKATTKQTAVEWLFLMLNNPNKDQEFANKLLQKAKAMEKEQIMEAHYTSLGFNSFNEAEQYYKENYESNA